MQDVSARYGHPVVVLNLVKSAEKRPRETILRKEFAIAIAYINQQVQSRDLLPCLDSNQLLKMVVCSSRVINTECSALSDVPVVCRVAHSRLPWLQPWPATYTPTY